MSKGVSNQAMCNQHLINNMRVLTLFSFPLCIYIIYEIKFSPFKICRAMGYAVMMHRTKCNQTGIVPFIPDLSQ